MSLLKHADYRREVLGEAVTLHYVRTKDQREVDFALAGPDGVTTLIEVKLSDDHPAPGLKYLSRALNGATALQVVQNLRQPQTVGGIKIVQAADWLASLSA